MLTKGSAIFFKNFVDWLTVQFDCRITELLPRPIDLVWIATEWAATDEYVPKDIQKPLELAYKLPGSIPGLSTITMTVPPETVSAIQHAITSTTEPAQLTGWLGILLFMSHFNGVGR
eukprot:m.242475 g.242475  ORF g.242475 m.242475 type:complete len:117 (-) comp54445_c0_seq8:397-747(-)